MNSAAHWGEPDGSQEAIKDLGTNGGGFANANSSHPFENPTTWTNWLELFLLLCISFSLPRTFGKIVGDKRQGRAIVAVMVRYSTTNPAGRSTWRYPRSCPRCLPTRACSNGWWRISSKMRCATPHRGKGCGSLEAPGDVVELRVIDGGPGIASADREAVFAPFQRRDDYGTGNGGGVGLGLAIARGFVEAMRGSITLDDTPGGGLTATVSLPVAR